MTVDEEPVAGVSAATPTARRLFRRVVVGIGADGGTSALALTHALAPTDAVFVLVHVLEPAEIDGNLPLPERHADATAAAVNVLIGARKALGAPCEIVVEEAHSVADGLHRVAEREAADLLVVAAHGPGEGEHRVLPAVLHHAPCPVAVAPAVAPAEPFQIERVGAAYRPTPAGRHGALLARAVATEQQAQLHAITVVPVSPSPWAGPAASVLQILARLDGTAAEIAERDLADLGQLVEHVAEGDPIHELWRFSGTVDLLVLGTRAAGTLHRILSGSTADALSTSSRCALLVVGHSGDDAGVATTADGA